jgi:hypothetical protein
MTTETAKGSKAAQASPAQEGNGKTRKRPSREERGLQPLTAEQRMTKSLVQNAENACKMLKAKADAGEQLPKEVLAALGVITGSLSSVLGA